MQHMFESIRKKLFLSHIASIIFLVLLVILVFIDLRFLQTQLTQLDSVRNIQKESQQLTLQEEKILLEQNQTALPPLLNNVEKLQTLVSDFETPLRNIFYKEDAKHLQKHLNRYQTLLTSYQGTNSDQLLSLTRDLRTINDEIRKKISQIEERHHDALFETADLVSYTLTWGVLFIVAIAILSAYLVSQLIVSPLHDLERQLKSKKDQNITKLTTTSNDTELQSFVSAFNAMLDKHKAQEKQIRNYEKAKAVGILVSGVAHELNNPLSNISTSAQLLLEDDEPRPELRTQWLMHIDSEIERARKIIRRLLDSVRNQDQILTKISADKLVGDSVTLIHRQLDPTISLDIEDIPDITLCVNHDRFQQVFINLIKNAVDAGAKNIWVFGDKIKRDDLIGNDHICPKGKKPDSKNTDNYFLFTIADDGSGISEDDIPNLFTPFFSTKTAGEGTGLGLYIVNEIVTEHDGCITVKNREENGCEFLILLPIIEDA